MSYNSTIKLKCKCGCGKYPTMSCFGYNYQCLPPDLKEKAGTKKKVQIKNRNKRVALASKVRKAQRETDGTEERELWFLFQRQKMTGVCQEGGCKESTNKNNDVYFRWSICHIVPKSLVPSVSTHPHNCIELCWQHHSEFDATFDKASKMQCFAETKRRFELFKHLIPADEMRKINPHLMHPDTADPS